MSRCLCCGKLLRTETEHEWHASCIKSFFGTKKLPDIDVSKEVLHQIVIDSTNKGYTVPGVQKKMSLHLTADGETPRLTLVNYPTGYILKPQALIDEIEISAPFKAKKLFTVVIKYIAPVFIVLILVSSVLDVLGIFKI